MKALNILVACEESQAVCKAFRNKGHNAFSCDILECSGTRPEWHILGDCLDIINGDCIFKTQDGADHEIIGKWDIIIAHPPCTYLSNAGARWLFAGGALNEKRYKQGLEGKAFFMKLLNADCDNVCVENPVPSSVYNLPEYTQIIQPYEYGHPFSKKTCLWLRGLPPLKPTNIIENYKPFCGRGGENRAGGSAKARSKTFSGIAGAMAEQWGNIEQ